MECEACVAVIMVSLTAFRSVFVAETSKARPWYSSSVAKMRVWRKASGAGHDLEDLPAVPPATLMGMRTFIGGPQRCLEAEACGYDELEDRKPLRNSDREV